MKGALTERRAEVDDASTAVEPMPVGAMVHQVANATAAIKFCAGVLRGAGTLTEPALAELARIEAAAALVVGAVKTFASAVDLVPAASAGEQSPDLYDVCCELAERCRVQEGRPVYCRAYGDCRGPWRRSELAAFISALMDVALECLPPGGMLNVALTGLGRHVRLDLHVLGRMTVEKQQECLGMASRIEDPRGAMLSVKATRTGGATLSLRLPR